MRLPSTTKDPSSLYLADPEGFRCSFQRALDVAEPYKPPVDDAAAPAGKMIIEPRAPYRVAKLFLDDYYVQAKASDHYTLRHHRGGFYRWSGSAYPEMTEATLRAGLYAWLDQCFVERDKELESVRANTALVGNVLDGLRAAAHLDDATSAPTWLDHVPDLPADEIVSCQNGLLHLPSLDLLAHTPAFFTHNALDFNYDPRAPEPRHWLAFLRQLWPDDQVTIDALQEMFGLCLTGDTRHQKAFLLVGPKRSGKGTIARVLTRLIGSDNTVGPTLAGLGTNFGLAPLIGKQVAIISDARLGGRADQAAIAERLLSITGEDTITVDRKFMSAWTGRLQTRFVILSNELPRLADASGALASRFIVLMLTNSFYGKEDHSLTDRLMVELPAILNWAIAGWRRLSERGYFVQPKSAEQAVQDLEDLGSPISAFLRERCEVKSGRVVEVSRLYEVWLGWNKEQGRERPGTTATFGRGPSGRGARHQDSATPR